MAFKLRNLVDSIVVDFIGQIWWDFDSLFCEKLFDHFIDFS